MVERLDLKTLVRTSALRSTRSTFKLPVKTGGSAMILVCHSERREKSKAPIAGRQPDGFFATLRMTERIWPAITLARSQLRRSHACPA
jgi:hypothetical protein